VDSRRARELVAAERARIEAALRRLSGEVRAEGALERQQTGESDSGSELATEMVEVALVADLRTELEAVARAEERIAAGTFGRSVESGLAIPDERLEAEPLAERTVTEQRRHDAGARSG
jgi:DnaK suppressor protein